MISEIELCWRRGRGGNRYIVGILKRTLSGGFTFRYKMRGCEKAKQDGFKDYPGFPLTEKIYSDNVLEVFSRRLIPKERTDNEESLSFWEVQSTSDQFDVLALTQGLSATDNFEFLGVFHYSPDFVFVTDIAGIKYSGFDLGSLRVGEVLNYVYEPLNPADQYAVGIRKGDALVGHVKRVHTRFFNGAKGRPVGIRVKYIRMDESLVYIRVSGQPTEDR